MKVVNEKLSKGKYWNGKKWVNIEKDTTFTNHFGKTELHPVSECTDDCPKEGDVAEYCPCCGAEIDK